MSSRWDLPPTPGRSRGVRLVGRRRSLADWLQGATTEGDPLARWLLLPSSGRFTPAPNFGEKKNGEKKETLWYLKEEKDSGRLVVLLLFNHVRA